MALSDKELWDQATRKPQGPVVRYAGYSVELVEPQHTEQHMTGRPSSYSEAWAQEICDWLADGGSLREWCSQEGHPSFASVYRWIDSIEGFRDDYARARELQAHNDGDRMNEIALKLAKGEIAPDVARVMADILKWTAGKRAAKFYGDKVQIGGDTDGAPIVVTWAKPTP